MYRNLILVMCVLCAAILIGCSKTDTGNSNMATNNANKGTTTATKTEPMKTSSSEKIGIAECDEYIAKYEACTPKVPEAGRAAYKSALDSTRASWKKLAADPTTRGGLEAACKQAMATQAAVWKGYGCQ